MVSLEVFTGILSKGTVGHVSRLYGYVWEVSKGLCTSRETAGGRTTPLVVLSVRVVDSARQGKRWLPGSNMVCTGPGSSARDWTRSYAKPGECI